MVAKLDQLSIDLTVTAICRSIITKFADSGACNLFSLCVHTDRKLFIKKHKEFI